jgi:hypothetical protein
MSSSLTGKRSLPSVTTVADGDDDIASQRRKVADTFQSSIDQKVDNTVVVTPSSISVHHQVTSLQFGYTETDDGSGRWCAFGTSTLYVTSSDVEGYSEKNAKTDNTKSLPSPTKELAFHLRGSCAVQSVTVECVCASPEKNDCRLQSVPVVYAHVDPMQHVLLRPIGLGGEAPDISVSGTTDPLLSTRFHADAQSSRGAAGMTIALRAASITSNTYGELRLHVLHGASKGDATMEKSNDDMVLDLWEKDLEYTVRGNGANSMQQRLQQELAQRAVERRNERFRLISRRLTAATELSMVSHHMTRKATTSMNAANRAFKVTIRYRIQGLDSQHYPGTLVRNLGGLQAAMGGGEWKSAPFVYTVAGVYGDHEGARCWIPVLDSASVHHRTTHNFSISVTAPIVTGLSIVGFGEDFGVTETLLHSQQEPNAVPKETGIGEIQKVLDQLLSYRNTEFDTNEVHVIPPSSTAMPSSTASKERIVPLDQILATTLWCSHVWSPIPCRSLGFAIGPFKIVDDPEYFLLSALNHNDKDYDDDDDDENGQVSLDDRRDAFLENARKNGEGIRQVYLTPKFERKYCFTGGNIDSGTYHRVNASLLPNAMIRLLPLSSSQILTSSQLDQTVTYATIGVPHRALSLMRDVLALPTYRTTSYTQVWIPNAVHGGCTSGSLHNCPEVLINPFLGGGVMDSRLLPPIGLRLPYYQGGRVLQFLQARCAIRGWITAAVPLGGLDDVGNGYLLTLFESFIMSLYQRGHGGHGEGGGKNGCFYSKRYATNSGLNSVNLDFLPVQNIEEEVVIDGVGAVPVEERHSEQLWRGASNGSESHTSAVDEFNIRQLLCKDGVEAVERGTDRDRGVPSPSMGWFGSYLSVTFLSSNATSSIDLGCGALEMLHPIGGLVYRTLKCEAFRTIVEGRSGVANFIRLLRVAFIAAHLDDIGEKDVQLPKRKKRSESVALPNEATASTAEAQDEIMLPTQPFIVCVNEVLKKKGLTHTLFTRALQTLSGRIKEPHLAGTLVDAEKHAVDPRTRGPFVNPEGFPNSFVRGASMLFCRVGVQVESTRDTASATQSAVSKGIQMQAYAEPVIPEGGIAYGGPITVRVVENEGSFREYVKDLAADGSRRDWGVTFLHAKPVTTLKAQTAASGTIERSTVPKDSSNVQGSTLSLQAPVVSLAFTDTDFHMGGYQSIELIRLTNLTPLLWVRVDPAGQYGGRISVCQPDACLAEQLFHDGDASAQVEAIRALAERPLRIQVLGKITTVYDVSVAELPVRVIGDCLRGSPALHSSLPHTPAVRAQAALAIGQWQNNKSPPSKDSVGADIWVGLNVLIQYFRERFYSNSVVMPTKFSRLVFKKSDAVHPTSTAADGGVSAAQPSFDTAYEYLDSLDEDMRKGALENAELVEVEEDEEYRVRSAVVTSIACIRAKDGLTPVSVIQFLETILESDDAEMLANIVYDDENRIIEESFLKAKAAKGAVGDESDPVPIAPPPLSYSSSMLVADALLALCHVNATPAVITDPTTGISIPSTGEHPMNRLFKVARNWLEWELYRENIRLEVAASIDAGISGNCHDSIAACAIISMSNIAILMLSTTDASVENRTASSSSKHLLQEAASMKFYLDILDNEPVRNDLTRAACAQALSCICCASDRLEQEKVEPVGLLISLEILLDRILGTYRVSRKSHQMT